jgi:hypothetical protein
VRTGARACPHRAVSAGEPKPVMTVLSSREYVERKEAPVILSILESVVGKVLPR